jgi:hypothetical protein
MFRPRASHHQVNQRWMCNTKSDPSCYNPTTSGLMLDVRLVSLCHACFPLSLGEGLRLDVRLVSLSLSLSLSLSVCVTTCPPTVRLQFICWASTLTVVVGYERKRLAKSLIFTRIFCKILNIASMNLICGSFYLVSSRLFMGRVRLNHKFSDLMPY